MSKPCEIIRLRRIPKVEKNQKLHRVGLPTLGQGYGAGYEAPGKLEPEPSAGSLSEQIKADIQEACQPVAARIAM